MKSFWLSFLNIKNNAAFFLKKAAPKTFIIFYQVIIFQRCHVMPSKVGEKTRAMRYPAPTAPPAAGAQAGFQHSF